MKKTTQMRINDNELCSMHEALIYKICSFVDHIKEDGTPVFIHTEENDITLSLYYKVNREMCNRGLYDKMK